MGVNFNDVPTELTGNIEPGIYDLFIKECSLEVAQTGSKMVQCDFQIVGTDTVIRWDNSPYEDGNGLPINLGLVKVRKMLESAGIPLGNYDWPIVVDLLKGKTIRGKLKYKPNSTFMQLDGAEIYPLENAQPSLEEATQEVVSNISSNAVTEESEDI